MAYFYKEGDLEVGPVGKADLQKLITAKKIGAKTEVRDENSDRWRPLAELARGKAKASQPSSPPPPAKSEKDAHIPIESVTAMEKRGAGESDNHQKDTVPVPATTVCSQCGRSFPQDEVLTYENQAICAACKPMFVQKLKEGASLPSSLTYGGFWIRFVAKFIDGIVMAVAQWAVMIPAGMMMGSAVIETADQVPPTGFFAIAGIQSLLSILIPAAYNTFLVGKYGATLGKMACRLKVVTPEGGKVSYARALGRYFAEMISSIILAIGYIMAAFDAQKRSLHDRICSTRVVSKG